MHMRPIAGEANQLPFKTSEPAYPMVDYEDPSTPTNPQESSLDYDAPDWSILQQPDCAKADEN